MIAKSDPIGRLGATRDALLMIQHVESVATAVTAPVAPVTVPLSSCEAGSIVRFHGAHLDPQDANLLRALGVTRQSTLTLCKAGEPCIVQVRSTRIGLSRTVASGILVVREPAGV